MDSLARAVGGRYRARGRFFDADEWSEVAVARRGDVLRHVDGRLYRCEGAACKGYPTSGPVPATPVGGSGWSRNSIHTLVSRDEVWLVNYTNNDAGTVLTKDVWSGHLGIEFRYELVVTGGADDMHIGLFDGLESTVSSLGLRDQAGFVGWMLDIYNNRYSLVRHGSIVYNAGATPDVTARDTRIFVMTDAGGGNVLYALKDAAGTILASYTTTAPSLPSYRIAVGGRTGGYNCTARVYGTPHGGSLRPGWLPAS